MLQDWLEETGIALPTPNPNYDPDYVVPRQVEALPEGARLVRRWRPAEDGSWTAARMVELETVGAALRLRAAGNYPEILTRETEGLSAGRYALQVDLRVPTSGRVRAAWRGGRDKRSLEVFPRRDGGRHTLTAVFEALEPIDQLRFAGPTHLEKTGHYDPDVHTDWIEVEAFRLYRWPADASVAAARNPGSGETRFFAPRIHPTVAVPSSSPFRRSGRRAGLPGSPRDREFRFADAPIRWR